MGLPKTVNNEMFNRIVDMSLAGYSMDHIASQLKTTPYIVRATRESDEFRDKLMVMGEDGSAVARNYLRAQSRDFAQDVWEAIKKLIKSDSSKAIAEGIKAYFRIINLEEGKENDAGGNITIQLPGQAPAEKIVTVVSGDDDDTVQDPKTSE